MKSYFDVKECEIFGEESCNMRKKGGSEVSGFSCGVVPLRVSCSVVVFYLLG